MNLAPHIARATESDMVILVISNLSFDFEESHRDVLHRIEELHQGIQVICDPKDLHLTNLSTFGNWGILPIFSKKQHADRTVHRFFDNVLKARIPVLTMYIDLDQVAENMTEGTLPIQVGKIIGGTAFDRFMTGKEIWTYLISKLRLFEMARASSKISFPQKPTEEIEKYSWSTIKEELDQIELNNGLVDRRGKFSLYLSKFKNLSAIPHEVGRLRAKTFNEVGEGSGKPIDLDTFDQAYDQLFLVDQDEQCIVGGYRIAPCDEILEQYGIEGLYMHTLYRIDNQIIPTLKNSIELGRSFIVQAYQRKQLPLFLLWNGILNYLKKREHCRYVFGLVSISRAYSDISRNLITTYLRRYHFNRDVAVHFIPRQEYYTTSSEDSLENVMRVLNGELIKLDELISEIEPENYRLPVLIRKYISQNARFIGFNIDPDFSHCVDGLMMLDFQDVPVQTLQLLQNK